MEEHETFGELYARLMDILNSSFNLGEFISNSKVIGKILRSLPERLRHKTLPLKSPRIWIP